MYYTVYIDSRNKFTVLATNLHTVATYFQTYYRIWLEIYRQFKDFGQKFADYLDCDFTDYSQTAARNLKIIYRVWPGIFRLWPEI